MSASTPRAFRLADLAEPGIWDDPYPLYRSLLDGEIRAVDNVVLCRHADVTAALRDPRLSSSRASRILGPIPTAERADLALLERCIRAQMPFSDPPLHTAVRRAMHGVFTPRAVERMRPFISKVVDELLDRFTEQGGGDFIADVAYPLPATVIAEMMGIPLDARVRFKEWSEQLVMLVGGRDRGAEQARRTQDALGQLLSYLERLASERRRVPGDDLFTALLAITDSHPELGREELYFNYFFLLTAGHETATNLFGNGVLLLLRDRSRFQLVRDRSHDLGGVIEEMLRFESPVQITARIALSGLMLGEQRIPAGASVVLLLGAANRDPRVFDAPDDFVVTRDPNRHLAFGSGAHFCLGAALARLEATVLFAALAQRPDIVLTAAPEWIPAVDFRGLASLPVGFA